MTNAQLFSYPTINLKFNKGLIARNAIPHLEIGQVIWGSLLGKDNKELTTMSLLNSVKFIAFVEKTREKFKKKYNDLRKFPKMNDADWE